MQPLRRITSRTVVIASSDIDTDQIIPARFLTTTSKEGLGQQLFADWRYQADGSPKREFVLNRPEAHGAEILVAGEISANVSPDTRVARDAPLLHIGSPAGLLRQKNSSRRAVSEVLAQ